MTVDELCALLKVSKATVYTHRKRRTGPPGYTMGRSLRFSRSDVLEWLESRKDTA